MINTTLCYLQRGQDYLMLHRIKKSHDLNQDKWIGIGGKFEDKESPEDCLLREAREETGLTLTRYRYRGLVTFVSDRWPTEYMHLFTADGWTGALKDCDEGVLEWIPRDKLLDLPHWEGDAVFLNLISRDIPFFSLKLCYEGERLVEAVLDGRRLTGRPAPAYGMEGDTTL
ncbi:MAG: NUDIX domain-containing protein [Lawsonibacter sp.]